MSMLTFHSILQHPDAALDYLRFHIFFIYDLWKSGIPRNELKNTGILRNKLKTTRKLKNFW